MIIKHITKRRYVHGGSGIFDIVSTKKALSAGKKAIIDNTDRFATGAVNKNS